MRIRPILFNSEMVQAILDGRKTVTRRMVKFPVNKFTRKIPIADNVRVYENTLRSEKVSFHEEPHYCFDVKLPCQRGDVLYVRETWGVMRAKRYDAIVDIKFKAGGQNKTIYFPYGGTDSINRDGYDEFVRKWSRQSNFLWHPSIHMPKEAVRIWLKVTDVRVERLQDMTLDDFLAEGVVLRPEAFNDPENAYMQGKKLFSHIWDSTINKEQHDLYGWDANPWVWVIEFERCKKPEEWCV